MTSRKPMARTCVLGRWLAWIGCREQNDVARVWERGMEKRDTNEGEGDDGFETCCHS